MVIFSDSLVHSISSFNEEPSNSSNQTDTNCQQHSEIETIITPYAFPMLIEYCVVSTTMLLIVWENCGNGLVSQESVEKENSKTDFSVGDGDSGLSSNQTSDDLTALSEANGSTLYEIARTKKTTTQGGTVIGWFVLCVTLGLTVTSSYYLYTENKPNDFTEEIPYGMNIALSVFCLIASCIAFARMTQLSFYDEELQEAAENQKGIEFMRNQYSCAVKHRMDQRLSTATLLSLVALKIFCGISAVDTHNEVLLADAIVSIIFAVGQSLFLAYAENKRLKTHSQVKERPGWSALQFLRIVNFALWVNNTFLLKNPATKASMNTTFGFIEWAVLSNIFQPLTILYYFHAMITIADVLHHVYTTKFVGVIRQSKHKKSNINHQLTAGITNMTFDVSEL